MLRALLERGVESGCFRELDSKLTGLALLGAANWTVKWFHPDGGTTAREVGSYFAEQFVRGVLAEGVSFAAPELEIPTMETLVQEWGEAGEG